MGTDIAKVPPISWAAPEIEAVRRASAAEDRKTAKVRPAEGGYTPEQAPDGRLTIEKDEETGDYVYRILDPKTGEVLKQWPREEVLRMRQAINAMRGVMLDRKV